MAKELVANAILSPEDIDRIFISYFVEELNKDAGGIPYGVIDLGGIRVKVHPYTRSLRYKQDVAGTESTYPGLFITSMQFREDTSKPNTSDDYIIKDPVNRMMRVFNQEVWYRFTYQIISAALSYSEDRRLAYYVHARFPKKYGSRSIQIGSTTRELLITDTNRDDILEDGIFRTSTTFEFSLPLLQDEGVIVGMIDSVDVRVENAGDIETTTLSLGVQNV